MASGMIAAIIEQAEAEWDCTPHRDEVYADAAQAILAALEGHAIIDGQFADMRSDIGKVHQRVDEIYGLLLGQNTRHEHERHERG